MDALKFCDARVEKANAMLKYRKIRRITTLFRLVELFVFLIFVARFFGQFHFSVKSSGEHFRGILVALISPRSVFLIGNVIVAVLLLKSRRLSAENGENGSYLYEEYVERCRNNHQICSHGEQRRAEISRRKSEKLVRVADAEESRRELRRSVTAEGNRRTSEHDGGAVSCADDEMSGDEFRRTVEEFIARQQRLLREEEALSDVVRFI